MYAPVVDVTEPLKIVDGALYRLHIDWTTTLYRWRVWFACGQYSQCSRRFLAVRTQNRSFPVERIGYVQAFSFAENRG